MQMHDPKNTSCGRKPLVTRTHIVHHFIFRTTILLAIAELSLYNLGMKTPPPIKSLGFNTLDEYMRSEHYKAAREFCLEQNKLCANCPSEATSIYFNEYTHANVRGENTKGVWCLCKKCVAGVVKTKRAMRKFR